MKTEGEQQEEWIQEEITHRVLLEGSFVRRQELTLDLPVFPSQEDILAGAYRHLGEDPLVVQGCWEVKECRVE
jgi:hypothetical protein